MGRRREAEKQREKRMLSPPSLITDNSRVVFKFVLAMEVILLKNPGESHPARVPHRPQESLWHLPKLLEVRGAQGEVPVPESLESHWALD